MWNGKSIAQGSSTIDTNCKFNNGDLVAVEWNPLTREIKYSVLETDKKHSQYIPSELLELGPPRFVVGVLGTSDISLIA